MPKLYVVRHAEPALRGVLLGRTDSPLSDAGRRAARKLWDGLGVDVIYTSPLARCRETAALAEAPVVVLDDLAEISYGAWDGLTWIKIEERFPEAAREKKADWFGFTPPGGERWEEFAMRVRRALAEILKGPLPAVIVGHVAVNSVLAAELSGIDPAEFNQAYCGVLELDV